MCSEWIDSTIKGTLRVKSSGHESHPCDEMQITLLLPPALYSFSFFLVGWFVRFVFILFPLCFLRGFVCLFFVFGQLKCVHPENPISYLD